MKILAREGQKFRLNIRHHILRLIAATYFETRIIYLGIPAAPVFRFTAPGL